MTSPWPTGIQDLESVDSFEIGPTVTRYYWTSENGCPDPRRGFKTSEMNTRINRL